MLHYQIILLICPSFLFRKSILSPKCISPISKSLSPGVNIRLYHHSTETETHIYFISKMAKSFDLLGFSRQKAYCLNMVRLTKSFHLLHIFTRKNFSFSHSKGMRFGTSSPFPRRLSPRHIESAGRSLKDIVFYNNPTQDKSSFV